MLDGYTPADETVVRYYDSRVDFQLIYRLIQLRYHYVPPFVCFSISVTCWVQRKLESMSSSCLQVSGSLTFPIWMVKSPATIIWHLYSAGLSRYLITHSRDMVIRNFPRWRPAAILDLVKPEIAPFDPPSPKIKEIIGKAVGTWSVWWLISYWHID